MTELLEQALAKVRALPQDVQDGIARALLEVTSSESTIYRLNSDEMADLVEADAELERGELASAEDVLAMWRKHGL
jgi:hypothetical protein